MGVDQSLTRQAGLPTVKLAEPKVVQDFNGHQLVRAMHRSEPMTLLILGNHRERIQLDLIPLSA